MSNKKEKNQIRQSLRIAIKLQEANLITQRQLREIAKNTLAQEITTSLEKKIERKSRKITALQGSR